jgi:NAD(P)-dependent dehydrogenase (short-subunit alcohol dehydrogenase family)
MAEKAAVKTALIVGASRGLGLGLAKELLGRGWNVTATVRAAKGGTGLEEFHGRVSMETVDINNAAMVDSFVERMKPMVFDVVFINAGVGGPRNKTVETIAPEDVTFLFMTNAISPVRLAYKLLPMLRPGTGILAFMSSILGSVAGNERGGMPIYGASKAALNHLTRSLVAGLTEPAVTVLSLHPGWVRTDMGGDDADIDVETSVAGLVNVLEAKAGSGGHEFLNYRGETIPW